MENWNVYIKQEPYFERVEVYITRSDGNKICVLGPDMQTETSYLKGSDMAKRDGCGPEYEMKKCYTEGGIIN